MFNNSGEMTTAYTTNTNTTYGYNTLGQLVTVTMNVVRGTTLSTPQVSTFSYDAVGNLTSETLPGGVTNTYTYDALNRVTDISDVSSSATLFTVHYTYNDNGQRASSTETQMQSGSSAITTGRGLAESIYRRVAELEDDAKYRDRVAETKRRQIVELTGLQHRGFTHVEELAQQRRRLGEVKLELEKWSKAGEPTKE